MKRSFLLLIGAFVIFLSSMIGLVYLPQQLSEKSESVPKDPYVPKEVAQGHKIYIQEGCVYCHSQQVRPEGFGADQARGWGIASIPADYDNLTPHVLGTMRTGPDLANIGKRQPSRDWHLIHLYNPRAVSPGSIMPPFSWLFKVVDEETKTGKQGIALPPDYQIEGKKVIPTEEAEHLVDYLLSLDQERDSTQTQ